MQTDVLFGHLGCCLRAQESMWEGKMSFVGVCSMMDKVEHSILDKVKV